MALTKPQVGAREERAVIQSEIRAENDGDLYLLTGYAARFNIPSKPLPGGWSEVIAPGAFDRSLEADAPVQFRFNHLPTGILARSENGTLELSVDDIGLRFKAQLNKKMQSSRDLFEAVKRGDYSECSFGFVVPPGGEKWNGTVRTLLDVDLFDCSLVGEAQYPQTSLSARAAAISVDNLPSTAELKIKADQIQRNIDNETCARVLKLGAEIRSGEVDQTDDEPPEAFDPETGEPLDEYERALHHDVHVVSFDENAGMLYTREMDEYCCYDYTRAEDTNAVQIDRSSRRVIS